MDNAIHAIIMAGSVLLLIIALTVAISSFTSLKVQVEDIVSAKDQIRYVQDTSGNFLNYLKSTNSDDIRKVQTEAIISALRRMRKEDYVMYIAGIDTGSCEVLPKLLVKGKEQKYDIQSIINENENIVELSMEKSNIIFYNEESGIQSQELNRKLLSEIYNETKGKIFSEYIGTYEEKTVEGVSSANKKAKKIITFVRE